MLRRDAMTSEFREFGDYVATNADWTRTTRLRSDDGDLGLGLDSSGARARINANARRFRCFSCPAVQRTWR
jgi:hypothetical protein